MDKYIIISRVLNPMSNKTKMLWRQFDTSNQANDVYVIPDSDITLVDGEKLDTAVWATILRTKKTARHSLNAPREAADKKHITDWLQRLVGPNDMPHLFIHFGGHNDEEVKMPLNALKRCFGTQEVQLIPFTLEAKTGGILENGDFLDIHDKGKLRDKLGEIAKNYREKAGVFGWFDAYESHILNAKENFEAAWSAYRNKRKADDDEANQDMDKAGRENAQKKYIKTWKAFEELTTLFKASVPQNALPTGGYYEKTMRFKIGEWDAKKQVPKASKTSDFPKFRADFAKVYAENLIVHPREEDFDAWLIVQRLSHLKKTSYADAAEDAPDISPFTKDPLSIKPILSVGLLPLWDSDAAINPKCEQFRKMYLDSRVKFWDSSIWLRYVPLLDENWATEQKAAFDNVLKDMHDYHAAKLYDTISAREFLEFHVRLYHNSFVAGVAHEVTRAHGGEVTPFSFHSETKIRQEAKAIHQKLEGLAWRILLIDDTGETNVQTVGNSGTHTKKQIVEEAIGGKDLIQIVSVIDLNKAKTDFIKDKTKHYDIILLDYLFHNNGKNEFGIDFLKTILNEANGYLETDCLGPLGKHYIVPISVYQNALTDNLHDAALLTHGDKWLITQGTDPLNKPHLFRFILFRLMERQVNKAFIAQNLLQDFRNNSPSEMMDNARRAYVSIITRSNKLDNLLKFYDTSLFAKSLLDKNFDQIKDKQGRINRKNVMAIGEHFQHLFVLIANGNTQFKPQMWEEYFWLKDRLMVDKTNATTPNAAAEKHSFWANIKQYIENL